MKKYIYSGILLLGFIVFTVAASPAKAQTASSNAASVVVFDKTLHDFGDIRQQDGKQHHVFNFTNKGNKPVIIQTVISSCGCTVPDWSHQPVNPGKTGSVTATFLNNQGAIPFDKSLSVYTNVSDKPIVLRIRGVVHAKKISVEETHPIKMGQMRLRKNILELGQIHQGSYKTDSTDVINTGKTALRVEVRMASGPVSARIIPEVLQPGKKGTLIYTLDAKEQKYWGQTLCKGEVFLDGKLAGVLEVKGNIKMDTRNLTQAEKARAAVPTLNNSSFNFVSLPKGKSVSTMFTLSNCGKEDLVIYKTDYSHTGIKAEMPGRLAPGAQCVIKASVNRPDDTGEVVYTISLITNAPSRPVINLLIYGTFEP